MRRAEDQQPITSEVKITWWFMLLLGAHLIVSTWQYHGCSPIYDVGKHDIAKHFVDDSYTPILVINQSVNGR